MTFALGAGKLFEIDKGGEFEDTIIGLLSHFLHEACIAADTRVRSQMH